MSAKATEQKMKTLVKNENDTKKKLASYLREINRREYWKELGFKSLNEFCRKSLGCDEFATRELLVAAGAILTQKNMTSADPKIQTRIENLKNWRKEKALRKEVSAFIIITNRTLLTIAKENPKTLEELTDIPQFGEKRMQNYGKEILKCLAN